MVICSYLDVTCFCLEIVYINNNHIFLTANISRAFQLSQSKPSFLGVQRCPCVSKVKRPDRKMLFVGQVSLVLKPVFMPTITVARLIRISAISTDSTSSLPGSWRCPWPEVHLLLLPRHPPAIRQELISIFHWTGE